MATKAMKRPARAVKRAGKTVRKAAEPPAAPSRTSLGSAGAYNEAVGPERLVNAAALASLALAPAPPANLRVLTDKLENTTRLEWDAGREYDLARYEVVWRETTAPQWQHSMDVGKSTGCTHPLSKDNYIFGVRSVDKDGHKSVVASPRPWKPEAPS